MAETEEFYEEQPGDEDVAPGGGEKLPAFKYDLDAPNLVTVFKEHPEGIKALRLLAATIGENFRKMWEDNSDARDLRASNWKIFACDLPDKEWPFEHAANVHDPLMAEAITRLLQRFKAELWKDRLNICNYAPVGPDDKAEAEAKSKHTNWQLREDIPDFFAQQAKGILEWFISGDVTFHSFYDPVRAQNRHECIGCDQFVTPFTYSGTFPDYSDAPYYARIHHLQVHELYGRKPLWEGVEAVVKRDRPSWEGEPDQPMADSAAEVEGIEIPEEGSTYKIIQYEGWEMLPDQDRPHWIQAFYHVSTGHLMQLSVHEEPSWKERERYETQMGQREEYFQHRDMFDGQATERATAQEMLSGSGSTADPMQAQQAQSILMQPPLPPPRMPGWMNAPTGEDDEEGDDLPPAMEMRPIHMFTHGQFIVPLAGNQGLGPGRQQADLNRMSNTALSQFTDSATLANCSVLITSGLVEFEREFDFSPGSINKVQGITGGELRNHIMPMDARPANPQLMELVKFADDKSQSSMSSPDVLSGAEGKSGETLGGINLRVNQASAGLAVSAQDFRDGPMRQVLINNGRLNAIHLPEDEVLHIMNHKTKQQDSVPYGRGLYQRGYNVTATSDASFIPKAIKQADANALVQMGQNDDMLKQNVAFRTEALKRYLEAHDLHDMVPLLVQAAPMQPPVQSPLPVEQGQASQPKPANGSPQ